MIQLDETKVEAIIYGVIGSALAALIIFLVRVVIPKVVIRLCGAATKAYRSSRHSYKEEILFVKKAIDKTDYSIILCFYFYHLFHVILWLTLSSISFVAAVTFTNSASFYSMFASGIVFLIAGAFINGGIITASYSHIRAVQDG